MTHYGWNLTPYIMAYLISYFILKFAELFCIPYIFIAEKKGIYIYNAEFTATAATTAV